MIQILAQSIVRYLLADLRQSWVSKLSAMSGLQAFSQIVPAGVFWPKALLKKHGMRPPCNATRITIDDRTFYANEDK